MIVVRRVKAVTPVTNLAHMAMCFMILLLTKWMNDNYVWLCLQKFIIFALVSGSIAQPSMRCGRYQLMPTWHFSCSLLLILDEAHRGGRSHVIGHGLDPFVTHLAVRYIVGILRADLTDVMDFVAQRPGHVAVIDRRFAWKIERVMRRILRGHL